MWTERISKSDIIIERLIVHVGKFERVALLEILLKIQLDFPLS